MARRDRLAAGRRGLCTVVLAVAAITTMRPTGTWADTLLVPSLSVSERYDTNVFFITAGENLTDYVTSISPSLLVQQKGRIIEGSATATVMGEVYAKNPGLNYVGVSGSVNLNLDQVVGRIDRRASLTITDSFSYTPRPPGFLSPDTGSAVPQEFVRGIQTWRANSITNIGGAAATYGLTQASRLIGSYTNMYMRFGNAILPAGTTTQSLVQTPPSGGTVFFTTRMQTVSIGPEINVTPRDVFTATFQRLEMAFEAAGQSFDFETKGGLVGWKRGLTPQFTASGSFGLSILTPGNNLQYLANAALQWKHKKTTATLAYSRAVFPSFFLAAAPLLSQVISATASYEIAQGVSLSASANYALNETISGTTLKFESYFTSLGMSYSISRTLIATASYSHSDYAYAFGGESLSFNRDVLMASLRKEWR